jgi:hypothetical protein
MIRSRIMSIVVAAAALPALAIAPASATDTRDYAKDDYAVIRDGLAPSKRFSLAHGDGEGGTGSFHVWLMAEPAHRRIAALPGIGSDNNLDTGPDSYRAAWSSLVIDSELSPFVIARSGSDEAIQSGLAALDCFASLAMKGHGNGTNLATLRPALALGIHRLRMGNWSSE